MCSNAAISRSILPKDYYRGLLGTGKTPLGNELQSQAERSQVLQQGTHQVHDEVQLNGEIHYEEDTGPGVPGVRWHHHIRETAPEKDTSLSTKQLMLQFPLQRQEHRTPGRGV